MIELIDETTTKEGRKIQLLKTTNTIFNKKVLIIGVFHGEEPQGEYLINNFLKEDLSNIKNQLYIIPCYNPDGKSRNKRQNANNIDLNRNFPTKNWKLTPKNDYFGGETPGSENETKFMIKILNKIQFDAILSIHAPFGTVNYDGPAEKIAKKISEITGYPVQADIGYPTPGSFGNYAGVERKIPTITLELPENESYEELWKKNKPVLDYLANEF